MKRTDVIIGSKRIYVIMHRPMVEEDKSTVILFELSGCHLQTAVPFTMMEITAG